MSNLLNFLETLAQEPQRMAVDDYVAATAGFDPVTQQALLAHDVPALVAAAGGRPSMVCAIMLPDNDEPQREEQPADPVDLPVEPDSLTV